MPYFGIAEILIMGDIQKTVIFTVTHALVYAGSVLISKNVKNHIGEGDFDIFMLILLTVGAPLKRFVF